MTTSVTLVAALRMTAAANSEKQRLQRQTGFASRHCDLDAGSGFLTELTVKRQHGSVV
ncbi:hypothetical protein [Mesorhizobium sp. B2-4-6]|uniref:hypothetical protein n=1 Tax=Mesorhizobium sp. B2-4-6 TaxID=2589943 RepID=UPI0015E31EB2|nr:hypothetical protein [Mesorhizobium sp. B2-4-6]